MNDHIYYLYVNGEIQTDMIFTDERLAVGFAEEQGIEDYQVVKWDVD